MRIELRCLEVELGVFSVAGKSPEKVRGRAYALPKNRASAEFCAGHFWPGSKVHVRTYGFIRPDVWVSAHFCERDEFSSGRMDVYVRTYGVLPLFICGSFCARERFVPGVFDHPLERIIGIRCGPNQ